MVQLARSEFLYVTGRTRGSRGEQLTEEQKRQGSLWSQRNLYRDVDRARARGSRRDVHALRRAPHVRVDAHGRRRPAPRGRGLQRALRRRARGGRRRRQSRLRSQTTLAVYTHATGQARELALDAMRAYFERMLGAAPRLRSALAP